MNELGDYRLKYTRVKAIKWEWDDNGESLNTIREYFGDRFETTAADNVIRIRYNESTEGIFVVQGTWLVISSHHGGISVLHDDQFNEFYEKIDFSV